MLIINSTQMLQTKLFGASFIRGYQSNQRNLRAINKYLKKI